MSYKLGFKFSPIIRRSEKVAKPAATTLPLTTLILYFSLSFHFSISTFKLVWPFFFQTSSNIYSLNFPSGLRPGVTFYRILTISPTPILLQASLSYTCLLENTHYSGFNPILWNRTRRWNSTCVKKACILKQNVDSAHWANKLIIVIWKLLCKDSSSFIILRNWSRVSALTSV